MSVSGCPLAPVLIAAWAGGVSPTVIWGSSEQGSASPCPEPVLDGLSSLAGALVWRLLCTVVTWFQAMDSLRLLLLPHFTGCAFLLHLVNSVYLPK